MIEDVHQFIGHCIIPGLNWWLNSSLTNFLILYFGTKNKTIQVFRSFYQALVVRKSIDQGSKRIRQWKCVPYDDK